MPTNLIWDACLTRRGTALAVVQPADVRACETCGDHEPIVEWPDGGYGVCPACAGTGRAWSWRIQPTAGMLCVQTVSDPGEWAVVSDFHMRDPEGPQIIRDTALPLAPPPGCGCTLAEALALLAVPQDNPAPDEWTIVYGWHLYSILYRAAGPPLYDLTLATPEYTRLDRLPELRLALQRHDALKAYIAGWREER